MKNILSVAALTGTILLAACSGSSTEPGANMVNAHDAAADAMDDRADALENRAEVLHDQADETRKWGKDKQKVMEKAAKNGTPINESVMNAM